MPKSLPARVGSLLTLAFLPQVADAAVCKVPGSFATIQKAVDDATCTDIQLEAQVYSEQVSIGRVGVTITGKGAGRTILRSPATRTKSTVTTSYLPRYTYVVEIKPGALATVRDLSIDGRSNATCTERFFGVRYHNSTGNLERVVVENVRGQGVSFAASCTNIFAVGVTSDGTGGGSVQLTQSTVRNFQAVAVLASGSNAGVVVQNSVIRGAGVQNSLPQTGIRFASGAAGAVDRNNLFDLRFSGDPCRGVGTGLDFYRAGQTFITANVVVDADRGLWLRENSNPQVAYDNRFIRTYLGIQSEQNGDGKVRISKNAISELKRSTASTVDSCFAQSGDGIAVDDELDTVVIQNSIADSPRNAIELGAGTENLDVQQNQSVRSTKNDIDDQGTANRLGLNRCTKSSPTGLCSDTP
jgi:hypothetical protein